MEKKIPWLKIAVAAAVVASAAVGVALFIKKKLDDLKFREEEYDFFDDDCEFYDSYNPMDEVVAHDDEETEEVKPEEYVDEVVDDTFGGDLEEQKDL